MKIKKEQYVHIPESLWNDDRFTAQEKIIICYRLGFDKKYFASVKTVADKFNVDARTVKRAFKKAKEAGLFINRASKKHDRNVTPGDRIVTAGDRNVTAAGHSCHAKKDNLPMKTELLYTNLKASNINASNIANNTEHPSIIKSSLSPENNKSKQEILKEFDQVFKKS